MLPTEELIAGLTFLEGISFELPFIGFQLPLLDLLHAVLINYAYRSALQDEHRLIGWGQGFVATIVMCAGGGSTVAILRGEPLGILKSNAFWGIYGLTYWAMFSTSYLYQFMHFLFGLPLVQELFIVADAILRNRAIVYFGVDGVNGTLGADKWVAKLLCGTLAGSGGGLWIDAFRLTHHEWSFSTPRLLHTASYDMIASFAAALVYLVLTTESICSLAGLNQFTAVEARAWSTVVLAIGLIYGNIQRRQQQQPATAAVDKQTKKD